MKQSENDRMNELEMAHTGLAYSAIKDIELLGLKIQYFSFLLGKPPNKANQGDGPEPSLQPQD